MDNKLSQATVISLFMCVAVALSTLYAPATVMAIGLFTHKVHFLFFLLFPALLAIAWLYVRAMGFVGPPRSLDTELTLCLMVLYCLVVVLLTGGVAGSPLSSLVAAVPLLAGPLIDSKTRGRVLLICAVGVIVVGALSHLKAFSPPTTYPNEHGWETSGIGNNLIATSIIASAIVLEIGLLSLRRDEVKQGVSPSLT